MSSQASPSPLTIPDTEEDRAVVLELTLSEKATAFLRELCVDAIEPLDEVVRRALGLYRLAIDAWKDGKVVGAAASPDALEIEFDRS